MLLPSVSLRSSQRLPRLCLSPCSTAHCSSRTTTGSAWSPPSSLRREEDLLSLRREARAQFEENFWTEKSITAEEYYRRIQYVDANSDRRKPASGANTDPGRVYLALGRPQNHPSSPLRESSCRSRSGITTGARILNTELRLIFYQKNSMGLPKLYSPTVDTIRALLLPEAATGACSAPTTDIGADIRNKLNVPPAEDEIVSAAVNIATGIKYSGNDEILGQITSPRTHAAKTAADPRSSRDSLSRPKARYSATPSPYGGSQIDLQLETFARSRSTSKSCRTRPPSIRTSSSLKFPKPSRSSTRTGWICCPARTRCIFTVDGKPTRIRLRSSEPGAMSDILRTDAGNRCHAARRRSNSKAGRSHLNANGKFAAVALPSPGKVTWMIRRGVEVAVAIGLADGHAFAIVELPDRAPPGTYRLEAVTDDRCAEHRIRHGRGNRATTEARH